MDLLISDDITALVSQNETNTDFESSITLQDNLFAPIAQGQVVGKITYNIDGVEYSSDLIASHNVEMSNSSKLIIQVILIIFILFLLYKLLFGNNKNKKFKRKKYRF